MVRITKTLEFRGMANPQVLIVLPIPTVCVISRRNSPTTDSALYQVHTQNQTMAAGTAFAISYKSDLSQVTAENLVVFSVLYK